MSPLTSMASKLTQEQGIRENSRSNCKGTTDGGPSQQTQQANRCHLLICCSLRHDHVPAALSACGTPAACQSYTDMGIGHKVTRQHEGDEHWRSTMGTAACQYVNQRTTPPHVYMDSFSS
jgi:hypothetical protein